MKSFSVYIHFPFCLSKCNYCDFVSFGCGGRDIPDLTSFYLSEILKYKELLSGRRVSSIYFGGGTPSLMEVGLCHKILNQINDIWGIENNIEITIETNPRVVGIDKIQGFKSAGVNRVSVGIQSFDDKVLQFLGRRYMGQDGARAILDLMNIFGERVSADFIYGLPDQTVDGWVAELNKIIGFGLNHLSLYQLIIEENTIFGRQYRDGKLCPIDDDVAVDMFSYTNEFLANKCPQYEVSNYAIAGFESQHNINYWEGGDYIGIGVAAAGRISVANKLFEIQNPTKLDEWCKKCDERAGFFENLTIRDRAVEMVMTGLRMVKGIDFSVFKNNLGVEVFSFLDMKKIDKFVVQGFIIKDSNKIKVSEVGFPILDSIIREIIL